MIFNKVKKSKVVFNGVNGKATPAQKKIQFKSILLLFSQISTAFDFASRMLVEVCVCATRTNSIEFD